MNLKTILISVFLLSVLVRVLNLGLDPSILLDSGQVGDEGYWVYNARNLALFGKTADDDFYHDFAAAPVFSLFSLISFTLLGVGFWQARLVSALAGATTVFFAYKLALPFGRKVAILAVVFVSFNTLLLLHNRLAVGESLSYAFLTASFYFLTMRRLTPAGIGAALAMLSKTTSFIYIPSFLLTTGWKFLPSFLLAIAAIYLPIILVWGDKVSLIYSSFGVWYRPASLGELWQNIFNFFTHPFWGSPFFFILATAAIVNIFNFWAVGEKKIGERRILITWILGILVLGPLISRISNARLLGLVVPISILASQTLIDRRSSYVDFKKIIGKIKNSRLLETSFILFISYPTALILSKLALAVLKRTSGNLEIVNNLALLSFLLFPLVALVFFKLRRYLQDSLVKFWVIFIILLPSLAFVDVFFGLVESFGVVYLDSTTFISLLKLLIVIFGVFWVTKWDFNLYGSRNFLFFVHFIFLIFGLATILGQTSSNISNSSKRLGEIAGNKAILGFMGHELSIENKTKPIYYAPRLVHIEGVNANFWQYNPEYLLQTNVFDSKHLTDSSWPTRSDLHVPIILVEKLDLSRKFLNFERRVEINLYKIGD